MASAIEVVDGKVRYAGRTLAEWVPEIVGDLVAAANPVKIILFGSVARGDDGEDSDIDLLVVLPSLEGLSKADLMADLRGAVTPAAPIDIFVTDPGEISRRKDIIGSMLYWPWREGKVLYDRPS